MPLRWLQERVQSPGKFWRISLDISVKDAEHFVHRPHKYR
jgi:hypothetical protein